MDSWREGSLSLEKCDPEKHVFFSVEKSKKNSRKTFAENQTYIFKSVPKMPYSIKNVLYFGKWDAMRYVQVSSQFFFIFTEIETTFCILENDSLIVYQTLFNATDLIEIFQFLGMSYHTFIFYSHLPIWHSFLIILKYKVSHFFLNNVSWMVWLPYFLYLLSISKHMQSQCVFSIYSYLINNNICTK